MSKGQKVARSREPEAFYLVWTSTALTYPAYAYTHKIQPARFARSLVRYGQKMGIGYRMEKDGSPLFRGLRALFIDRIL